MKTAIVTGVRGGIGRACAISLSRRGYAVVGMGRSAAEDDPELEAHGIKYIQGDISRQEDREALVEAACSIGTLSVLVNVAGVAPRVRADLLSMTEESYDYVMGINLKGTLFLTQLCANRMIAHGCGGYIVNVSSCSAYTSSINRGEYCISKAGVSMLTRLFADRLAGEGILVNEVCPGIIETDMTRSVKEKYDRLIAEGLIPLARWGTPDDVARAVVALCDGSFAYTTGESFILDGGMHIRRL